MDPNQIFISYAREDRPKAEALAAVLAQRGWAAWWDREIPVGLAFDEVIEKALDGARCVVVLWSAHSVASRWVKAEAQAGLDKDRLVPVLLDEEVRLPLAFRAIEGAQLHDWDGESAHPELDKLARRITELLAHAPSPAQPAREPHPAPRPAPERRALTQKMVLLVGVALAAGAFGAWTLFGSSKPPAQSLVATLQTATVSGSTPTIPAAPPAPAAAPAPAATDPRAPEPPQPIPAAVAANPRAFVLAARADKKPAEGAMGGGKKTGERRVPAMLDPIKQDAPAGRLSKEDLKEGMKAVKSKVRECFGPPGKMLDEARVVMFSLVIDKRGKVASATVTSELPLFRACIESAIKGATFPPSDGLSAKYVFTFK